MGRTARAVYATGTLGAGWLVYLTTADTAPPPPPAALPTGAHVAVIGAGPAGLASAYRLAAAGAAVTVYDKEVTYGRGAAAGNDGLLGAARGRCLSVQDMVRNRAAAVRASAWLTREWWATWPRLLISTVSREAAWGNEYQRRLWLAERATQQLYDEAIAAFDEMSGVDGVPALKHMTFTTSTRPAQMKAPDRSRMFSAADQTEVVGGGHPCGVWRFAKTHAAWNAVVAAAAEFSKAAVGAVTDDTLPPLLPADAYIKAMPVGDILGAAEPEYSLSFAGKSVVEVGGIGVHADAADGGSLRSTNVDNTCDALYRACVATGRVKFRFDTRIACIAAGAEDGTKDRYVLYGDRGQPFHGDNIVICAGAGTGPLVRGVRALPLCSMARCAASETETTLAAVPAEGRCIIDGDTEIAVLRRDNALHWYAPGEFTGAGRCDDAAHHDLRKYIRGHLPATDAVCVETRAVCLSVSGDYCPVVGHVAKNVWVNAGHGTGGYQLALPTAARLVKEMLSGEADALLRHLSPHRFALPHAQATTPAAA